MTDPIKALAEAARMIDALLQVSLNADASRTNSSFTVSVDWCQFLQFHDALAAYDAAAQPPTDAEVEDAIDAYRDACYAHAHSAIFGEDDEQPSAALAADDARKALLSLMRRARPVSAERVIIDESSEMTKEQWEEALKIQPTTGEEDGA